MPRFAQPAQAKAMETAQIKQKITDLSERTTALRGYL